MTRILSRNDVRREIVHAGDRYDAPGGQTLYVADFLEEVTRVGESWPTRIRYQAKSECWFFDITHRDQAGDIHRVLRDVRMIAPESKSSHDGQTWSLDFKVPGYKNRQRHGGRGKNDPTVTNVVQAIRRWIRQYGAEAMGVAALTQEPVIVRAAKNDSRTVNGQTETIPDVRELRGEWFGNCYQVDLSGVDVGAAFIIARRIDEVLKGAQG